MTDSGPPAAAEPKAGSEPKLHHTVPQFYLERFAVDGNVELVRRDDFGKSFPVIVPDLSRLSRDRIDSGVLVRQLDDLGVRVPPISVRKPSDMSGGGAPICRSGHIDLTARRDHVVSN